MRKASLIVLSVLFGLFTLSCGGNREFVVISGSENQPLEPILQQFARKNGYRIHFKYKGSVDIMLEIRNAPQKYDAVWPASGIWITLGDAQKKIKYAQSIMTSPVVFGVRKSVAQKLGWIGKKLGVRDILKAIRERRLRFIMTSASQSNSGASAYFGFLYALLGNPEFITVKDLHRPDLRPKIRELLSGIDRSSGSSGWLKDLYLTGRYDAMVNYESVMIEANQELVRQGKEPLYLFYPSDGLVMADSQLGYVNNGDANKEKFFRKLQDHLLSDPVQRELLNNGRRTGFGGSLENAPKDLFNPEWGIDSAKLLSPIKLPSADVILEALTLYQTEFRKPSLTVYCLDYSGSMSGEREDELKHAMSLLLDEENSKQYLLQSASEDVIVVLPFSDAVKAVWKARGNRAEVLADLLRKIRTLEVGGSTDIYSPVIAALEEILKENYHRFIPAIILMTDGESNTGKDYQAFKDYWMKTENDVPVLTILFGDASEKQLKDISEFTRGAFFNGQKDLVSAFRKAKGFN